MSVPAEKIEAIRQGTDIATWIGRCIQLKKTGRNYVGLCPFHAEKSPSFSVSAHKNMYYCFGCHVGGDVFDFVMRYDRLDFGQAARKLAAHAGVQIDAEAPERVAQRRQEQDLMRVNEAALAFFVAQLWGDAGAPLRRYLTTRALPAAFAKAEKLGFGGEPEAFFKHMRAALEALALPESTLAQAGLVGDDNRWPLFSGRLVFPILDTDGRLVGFGGRRLSHDKNAPKYINSRESVLFNKRQILYGLHTAQSAMRRSRRIILVEGYMDVLAARRADLPEAVAAMGTALTPEHAALCKRVAEVAFILLDADPAGQRAAYKTASALLAASMQVRLVALAPGDDPDSVVAKHGSQALQHAVARAKPAVEYFMHTAFAEENLSVEARAQAARYLMPLLLALPTGLERDLYMSRLADKVGVTTQQLEGHVQAAEARVRQAHKAKASRSASANAAPSKGGDAGSGGRAATAATQTTASKTTKGSATSGRAAARAASAAAARELDLLRELLLFPSLRSRLGELAEYMLVPEHVALLESLADAAVPTETVLATHVSDVRWRQRLLAVKPVTGVPEVDLIVRANRTFDDILARLKWRHVDAFLNEVLQQIAKAEALGEATDGLMRRKQELTARKRVLRRATRIERVRA